MRKKLKFLLLLVFIGVLYVVTLKGVLPFVLKVADSELFLKQTEDDPVGELHNNRTYTGLLHCENQLRNDHDLTKVTSPSAGDDYKAWGLGDHIYLIKAALDVPEPDKSLKRTRVACKIKYQEGEEANPDSWSILGVGAEGN